MKVTGWVTTKYYITSAKLYALQWIGVSAVGFRDGFVNFLGEATFGMFLDRVRTTTAFGVSWAVSRTIYKRREGLEISIE
jgi:hypothetical protein